MICVNIAIQLTYSIEGTRIKPVKSVQNFIGRMDFIIFSINSILTSFILLKNERGLYSKLARINEIHLKFFPKNKETSKKLKFYNKLIYTLTFFFAIAITLSETIYYYFKHKNLGFVIIIKFTSMALRSIFLAIFFIQFITFILIISISYEMINQMILYQYLLQKKFPRVNSLIKNNQINFLIKAKYADDLLKEFCILINRVFNIYFLLISLCFFLEILYASLYGITKINCKWSDIIMIASWISFFAIQFLGCIWACDYTTHKVFFNNTNLSKY